MKGCMLIGRTELRQSIIFVMVVERVQYDKNNYIMKN